MINDTKSNNNILMPINVLQKEDGLYIVHFVMKRGYLREPFFIDSLLKIFDNAKNQVKLLEDNEPLAQPVYYHEDDPWVVLVPIKEFILNNTKESITKKLGFIFHMSRCGSTLAAQMLADNNKFYVLSEPSIINSVLDPALNVSDLDRKKLVTACISALVSTAPIETDTVCIKFRSWNTFYLDLIIKDFAKVKWLYIHRHGMDVLSSVIDKPPGWLRSKNSYAKYFSNILSLTEVDIREMTEDEFISRILGGFCRIIVSTASKQGLSMDYVNLKKDFIEFIIRHWNVNLSNKEVYRMQEISGLYSKNVDKKVIFISDTELKRSKVTKQQTKLIDRFVESERTKLQLSKFKEYDNTK